MTKVDKYKGVVFDFNGTLFWDTPLHNIAWNKFLAKHDLSFSDEEFFRVIHGKNNRDLLKSFFEGISEKQIAEYIIEKEGLYQQLCIEKNFLQLAPGAVDFFEFLKSKNIPYTIATASGKENVDFYFEHLGISKWFDYDKIIYNNGQIKGKPHPEIYQKAMQLIDRKPEEVIIFEDAIAGLEAARNAQAGKIIVVNSNNDDYSEWKDYQIIQHFDEVSRDLF